MILFWLEFSVSVNRKLRYKVQLCKVTQVLYLNSEWNQTRQRTSKRTGIFMKRSPRQTHTHTAILWFIDGNNSLRKKPSTTSVSSDHTGSEHTGHIHSNQPLGMCNIWFGISVNKQIVVLWFQRGFTIWLVLWMSASGRRTETSWLVDLCKMAVLWLFSGCSLSVSGAARSTVLLDASPHVVNSPVTGFHVWQTYWHSEKWAFCSLTQSQFHRCVSSTDIEPRNI